MRLNNDMTNFSNIHVDLADMKATNNPRGRLSTYSLGSCVAVAIHDAEANVGGLLNFMLPESAIYRQKAMTNPFLYADTGIPMLFRRAYKLGADKGRIVCKVAGAGNIIDPDGVFNIGMLNYQAASNILTTNGIQVTGELIGGFQAMSMTMYMDTGRVVVNLPDGEEKEI